MSLEIKQEDDIWTLDIREKLAFKDFDKMNEVLKDFLLQKKQFGNYKQLKQKERKDKFKKSVKPMLQLVKNTTDALEEQMDVKKNG